MNKASKWLRNRLPFRTEALCLDLTLILMCGLAFSQGLRTTGDLDWPDDIDLYRDIAQAQTILDGYYWADPLYLGETLWYNPLVPALVAGASWLTNLPVHLVYTRIGAYLNLLAPISFYALVTCLFDRWTAVASTLGFLFVVSGNAPSWASATYSPWLFTASFVQSLFYIALVVYKKALYTEKHRWYLATGVLLGFTFLGHTAPALILGSIIGVFTLQAVVKSWSEDLSSPLLYRAVIDFGIIIILALTVSAPFVYSILGHYRLRILNKAPSSWVYDALALSNIRSFISENLSLLTVVVCVGLIGLVLRHSKHIERNLLLLWLAVSSGFIAYSYIWQLLQQHEVRLPSIVPAFHFLFYFKAVESVFFGYGVVIVSRFVVGFTGYLIPFVNRQLSAGSQLRLWSERVVLSLLILVAFVTAYPSYKSRYDFVTARVEAQHMSQRLDEIRTFTWIQEHSQPMDVFLTSDNLSVFVVGASGRKVVAADRFFSNPYVDWSVRASDRDLMFEYLKVGDQDGFGVLVSKYHVTYIVASGDQSQDIDKTALSFLHREFASGNVSIYRVTLSPHR